MMKESGEAVHFHLMLARLISTTMNLEWRDAAKIEQTIGQVLWYARGVQGIQQGCLGSRISGTETSSTIVAVGFSLLKSSEAGRL